MQQPQPGIQFKPLLISIVQRKCADCEDEEKQMRRKEMNGEETTADNNLESYVGSLNSSGGQSFYASVDVVICFVGWPHQQADLDYP